MGSKSRRQAGVHGQKTAPKNKRKAKGAAEGSVAPTIVALDDAEAAVGSTVSSPSTDSDVFANVATLPDERSEKVPEEHPEELVDEPEHDPLPEIAYLVDPVEAATWDRVVSDSAATTPTREPEEWVDLILEASTGIRAVNAAAVPVNEPPPPVRATPRARSAPSRRPAAVPSDLTAKRLAKATAKAANKSASQKSAPASRWRIVAPATLLLLAVAYMNRPASGHDPLPAGLLGAWTTDFWKYEQQTLEFRPDTVVLTLDEAEEQRLPITGVETRDAGRETAIVVTYRAANGTEKTLDFLADYDPTTALRFRNHSGLIWTRPTP